MRLLWHRRDLRLEDNVGLNEAAVGEEVLPVFVFDANVLEHGAPARISFLIDAVASLRESYRDRGGELFIASGDPRTVIPSLVRSHDISKVHWNEDYSGLARKRDGAVRDALADEEVPVETHHDTVIHPPGTIRTNDGEPYQVFSYYWRKWQDREKPAPRSPPSGDALAAVSGDPIPTLQALAVSTPKASIPPAGTAAARNRLRSFLDLDVYRYDTARDYPAEDATSRLSPHLKFGTIGPREVDKRARAAATRAETESDQTGVTEFRSQLAWREFYMQVLYFNPSVIHENYSSFEHPIEWRSDPAGLQAWKDGETGYPIVDAGMRQLRSEAYMHNRVRMIVASFLTKDLLIDWREGYDWFRKKLVDHDTANDTGGWQWAASTGTDAQPYFRIFNPMSQGEQYDPVGEYIRQYVSELQDVETEHIHNWHTLDSEERSRIAPDYPHPIVNHSKRREAALEMFERARGEA